MSEDKNILKDLKVLCDNAESLLNNRSKSISEKEAVIDSVKLSIEDAKSKGVETKAMESSLKTMQSDLVDYINNQDDLIDENIYIIEASESIRNFSGWSKNGYKTQRAKYDEMKAKKSKVESINSEYETKISISDGDEVQKDKLRLDIISNEEYLKSIERDFVSFEGQYSTVVDGVSYYDGKITSLESEKQAFQKELDELDFEIKSGSDLLSKVHRNFVDNKMDFNALGKEVGELEHLNSTYGTSSIELRDSVSISDDVKKELDSIKAKEVEIETKLDELKGSKNTLVKKLNQKEVEVKKLNKEKVVLENTNEVKDLDIKTLGGKIKAWESNYSEFEELVNNLEDYVGYPQYSNMEGDDAVEGQNPLEPLIVRLKSIIEFVESEDLIAEEDASSKIKTNGLDVSVDLNLNPYLLGAAALGVLLIAKR